MKKQDDDMIARIFNEYTDRLQDLLYDINECSLSKKDKKFLLDTLSHQVAIYHID